MAGQQLVARAALQQVSAGAQGDGPGDVGRIVEVGEDQDRQVRLVELDAAQGGQAVAVGHADVQQHHVDFVLQGVLDGRRAGGHFRDHLDFGAGQQALQAAADDLVVVGNQQSDLALLGHARLLVRKMPKGRGARGPKYHPP